MRGDADAPLLEKLDAALAREATGLEPTDRGAIVFAGVRTTQRIAIGGHGGGVAVFTWPAELKPQAERLYAGGRGRALLEAAGRSGWEIEPRPHLAFWLSKWSERLYLDARLDSEAYVRQLSEGDLSQVGEHPLDSIEDDLWPWLLRRGYASPEDEGHLPDFLDRLAGRGGRPAHFRPGLRLMRRWSAAEAARLRDTGALATEVQAALNTVLGAMGDPLLPAGRPLVR